MKRLFKIKTIQVTLVLSFIFHVFFIGYFDSIFINLPVEKNLKKQSVACIALGKKDKPITPIGNLNIQEYDKLVETQDSGNKDIIEKSIIPEKPILKKSMHEEIIEKIQTIQPDKKEKVFSPDKMMPKINEEQTDTLKKEDITKNILPEENIKDSEKKSEEIFFNKPVPVNKILPEKETLSKQEKLWLENEKEEKLPVQFPENNKILEQQITEESEKKNIANNLKTEIKIGKKNPKVEISSSEHNKKTEQALKSLSEKIKDIPVIKDKESKKDLAEKPENKSTGQSQWENTKNFEEDGKDMVLEDNRETNEEILDFTGELYADEITPPALKDYRKPVYPKGLREREIEGKVMLDVLLSRKGLVEEIKIHKSSGYDVFDKAAIQSVLKWRFMPAGKAGRQMACRVIIPVNFQIK